MLSGCACSFVWRRCWACEQASRINEAFRRGTNTAWNASHGVGRRGWTIHSDCHRRPVQRLHTVLSIGNPAGGRRHEETRLATCLAGMLPMSCLLASAILPLPKSHIVPFLLLSIASFPWSRHLPIRTCSVRAMSRPGIRRVLASIHQTTFPCLALTLLIKMAEIAHPWVPADSPPYTLLPIVCWTSWFHSFFLVRSAPCHSLMHTCK
jgi:hypothetical protein